MKLIEGKFLIFTILSHLNEFLQKYPKIMSFSSKFPTSSHYFPKLFHSLSLVIYYLRKKKKMKEKSNFSVCLVSWCMVFFKSACINFFFFTYTSKPLKKKKTQMHFLKRNISHIKHKVKQPFRL